MKILIIGTSKITASHIKVLRKKNSNCRVKLNKKKSKNLIKISKNFISKKLSQIGKVQLIMLLKLKL